MKTKSKTLKTIPFEFILDRLSPREPLVKRMFGCFAVYLENKIVFILRDRKRSPQDNGIWMATTKEHHQSLKNELPSIRSIKAFGPKESGWQVLPVSSGDFEESGIRACELVLQNDPRIGKIPKSKRIKLVRSRKRTHSKGNLL
jgi:hypothetical protein